MCLIETLKCVVMGKHIQNRLCVENMHFCRTDAFTEGAHVCGCLVINSSHLYKMIDIAIFKLHLVILTLSYKNQVRNCVVSSTDIFKIVRTPLNCIEASL